MEGFPGRSSGSSAYSAEVHAPVSSLTPSGKFAIASQLISQLADLIEGPPEKFAKRIAVLRKIQAAWGEDREVVVVPQDTSYVDDIHWSSEDFSDDNAGHAMENQGGRLNTSSVFEDLGKHRIQVSLQKMDIREAGVTLATDVQDAPREKLEADDSEADESYHDATSEFQGDHDPSSDPARHPRGGPADDKDTSLDKDARTPQSTSQTSPLKADSKRTALVCKKCGQGFQLGESSSDRPFACPHCQQSASKPGPRPGAAAANSQFESSNETPPAIGDSSSASENSDRPFPCPVCPKRFKARSHLAEHIRRHTQDKPFSCGVCGKAFCTKSNRNGHEKTHRGQANPKTGQVSKKRLGLIPTGGSNSNLKTSKVKGQNSGKGPAGSPQSTSDTPGVDLAHQDEGAASPSGPDTRQTSHGKDQRYQCDICDVTFSTKATLRSHRNGHCKCETCGIQFPTKGDLRLHEKTHSGSKMSSCHTTSEKNKPVFGPKGIRKKYERLRLSQTTKESYPCSVCNKVLQTVKDLRRHQQTHTNERPHVCEVCSKRLRTAANLKVHMRIHTGERPFTCILCPMRFRQRCHLSFHWRTVHKKKVLKCSTCPRIFIDPEKHRHHEWVQHRINQGRSPVRQGLFRDVEAETASRSSKNASSSKRREKQAATSSGDPWPCNECGKHFPTVSELQAHCKVHVSTKSNQCPQCLKTFSSNSNLRRHVSQSHLKSPAFNCDICGKHFVREGTLKQHMTIHFLATQSDRLAPGVSQTREMPAASAQSETVNTSRKGKIKKGVHQCPYCQKMLSTNSSLRDHIRNHTNERPYPCRVCGKLFKQRSARRTHELSHAKNFNCSVCHSPFSTKVALGEHLRVEHKQRSSPDKSGKRGNASAVESAQNQDELAPIDVISGNFGEAHLPKSFTGVRKAVNQGKHCCRFCGKSLSSRTRLLCHEKLHTDKQSLACNICKETFLSSGSLTMHMQTHQKKNVASSVVTLNAKARKGMAAKKKKDYKCQYCLKQLGSKGHLVEHERIHTGEKPFHCDACEASYTTKSALVSHKKRKHLQSPHKKIAHQSRSPTSQVANADTSHSPKVPSASTSHSPKVPSASTSHSPEVANASTSHNRQVANASTSHNRQVANASRSFSPKVANAHTSNSHQESNTSKSHSPKVANASKSYSPKVATANRSHSPKAANASASNSRQVVNAGRSPIPQVVSTNTSHSHRVSNSYTNPSQIKASASTMRQVASVNGSQGHQATKLNSIAKHKGSPHKERECLFDPENNQKISQCKICGQVFVSSKKLAIHEKAHTSKSTLQTLEGEDSYSFSEMTSGKDKVSPAEKIYKCSFCAKTGKRRADMIQHVRTHTGEKPFDCDCGKAFTSKSSLNAHMRNSCRLTKQTDSML